MGNAKSMATGGVSSAVGPVLMRKKAPFRLSKKEVITSEAKIYRDGLFRNTSGRIQKMSFAMNQTQMPTGINNQVQAIGRQLNRITPIKKSKIRHINNRKPLRRTLKSLVGERRWRNDKKISLKRAK